MYRALTHDEIQKVKKERKQKEAQHKQKISDNRQHLSNIRVIQRHLVFVVGLSNKMADIEVLKRPEYFGSYGKIMKIVINPNTNYAGPQGPSASAYITYTREDDALKAILAINEMQPPLKIRASLGTTKYCTHYLRNLACPKVDCMYLHDVGDPSASFTKEDMTAGKHQIFEKNLLDDYAARMAQLERDGLYDEYNDQTSEHYHSHHHHHHHHMDTNTKEDWGESESTNLSTSSGGNSIEVVSTPPTRSSWCTKADDVNVVRNEPSPTEYPVLEARKPSPKQSTEAPPPPQPQARISPQPSQPPEPARVVSAPINTPKPPLTTKPISPVEPVVKAKAELSDTSLDSVSSSQNSLPSLPQSNIQTSSQNDISQINNNSTQSAQTDPHNISPNSTQSDRSHTDIAAVSPNSGSSMSQDNVQSTTTIQADDIQSNNVVQSNLQTSLQDGLPNNFNLQSNNLQANNLQANNLQANNLQANSLQANSLQQHNLQQHSLQQSSLQNNNNNMQNNLLQNNLHTLLRNNNINNNLQNSLQNILPNGTLNGALSTGWTTKSFDTPVVNSPSLLAGLSNKLKNNTTTTTTAAANNSPFWPSTSDLGLCNLKLPNDDDLGK
jgi:CCR4-NOT transcription complex subunit 4